MTFLICVAAFVALACLGLPLAVLALFVALGREKTSPNVAAKAAPDEESRRAGSIPGPLGVT